MSMLSGWALSVLGIAVIASVAEMLLPQGKTQKAVRSCVAAAVALAVITPLPSLFSSCSLPSFEEDTEAVVDGEYLQYIEEYKRSVAERGVMQYLEQNGYSGGFTVRVELDGWKARSAGVFFVDTGMTGGGEHINKSEITRLIAEYLGIGEEAVMAYG